MTGYVDTVVDVIDTQALVRLQTLRLDRWASSFLPGRRIALYDEENQRLEIVQFEIEEPRER
jgi:hypothetical protein